MRLLVGLAFVAAIAYAFVHFYGSYQYSQRRDELKSVAEQATASLKECQRHYTVELKYSEISTKTKCQEVDNVATTALRAWQEYRSMKNY